MRSVICFAVIFNLLLIGMPEKSYCNEEALKVEVNCDYLTHAHFKDRYIDTVSLHVLENISKKSNWSVYRGLTVSKAYGNIVNDEKQTKESTAVGFGPVYMLRNEKNFSGKLNGAIDISGGVVLYDKPFPAEGRYYNFMWRIGPRLIYKLDKDTAINIGYTLMHVSNGFKSHNPGYNGEGVSLGFVAKF